MDELDDLLRRGAEGYEPDPERGRTGLDRRLRRRQRTRRIGAVTVSLTMFSATLSAAVFVAVDRELGRRPVAGPSSTPTPQSSILLGKGRTWCSTLPASWFDGEKGHQDCITQTGDVVVVASGTRHGSAWSMEAFDARYTGPDPEIYGRRSDGEVRTVQIPMICSIWKWNESAPDSLCEASIHGERFVTGFRAQEATASPPAFDAIVFHRPPLEGIEPGRAFSGLPAGDETAMWFWTPSRTARVNVVIGGETVTEALLFGPFKALDTDLKWSLVFLPGRGNLTSVKYTAYDSAGMVLWTRYTRYDSLPEPGPTP